MKKVLVILNGTLTPQYLVDFSISVGRSMGALLHAVFINYASDLAEYNYPFPNDLSLTRNDVTGKTIGEENRELIESSVQLFKDKCKASGVDFFLEAGNEISLKGLLELSAFSDIVLADANEPSIHYDVADLLATAHCPVYLVSKEVRKVEHNIFTYDGSISSIYAIKMYSYLFPDMKDVPAYLVYITNSKNDGLPNEEKINLWVSRHYSDIQTKVLHGNLRDELVSFTGSVSNSLAVMGSFGRSATSRFFHKSLATSLIKEGSSSLFIGHV